MFRYENKLAALRLLFGAMTALCLAPHALAANIANLFNTGVNASGVKVISGTPDIHYASVSGGTVYITGSPNVAWSVPSSSPLSNWVSVDNADGSSVSGGNYVRTYRTTFTLPASALLSSVVIQGKVAADNNLISIVVNNIPINFALPGYTSANFTSFHNFTIPASVCCNGLNKIDFIWKNQGISGAINVQFTQATYAVQTPATATISSLFNTGVNSSGAQVLPANTTTAELHYSDLATAGVFVVKNPTAGWLPVNSSLASNWISLDGDMGFAAPFVKTYRTNFNLPGNFLPGTVQLAGRAVVDNRLNAVYVNNGLQAFTIPTATSASFTAWHNFTLAGTYSAGTNAIDFQWQNDASVSALRVEFTQKTYQYYRSVPCMVRTDTGNGAITLRWMAPEAIRSRVKRSGTPGGPYTTLGETTDTVFVDANVSIGKKYYYVVSTLTEDAESDNSAEVSAIPLPVVACWRFEEGKTGGQAFQLDDSAGNGNTLQAEDASAAPFYAEGVTCSSPNPFQENALALDFSQAPGSSLSTLYATGDINARDFSKCTIEASFLLNSSRGIQTILSRSVDGFPDSLFSVQVTDGSGGTPPVVSVQALQSDGSVLTLNGVTPVQPGQWHSLAVVSDGSTLSLYLQTTPNGAYNLENARPHKPYVGRPGSWKVGHHGDPHEYMDGYMDEIRLCDAPLNPSQFLFRSDGRDVTGQIALDGVNDLSSISAGAPLGKFEVSFRIPGTTTEVYAASVDLYPSSSGGPYGVYAVTDVPAGTYDVAIKGSKNLRVILPNVTVGSGTVLPGVTLPGGDASGDNMVDVNDFGIMVNSYSATYDPNDPHNGYNSAADFNDDGAIDIIDFSILVNNYSSVGPL